VLRESAVTRRSSLTKPVENKEDKKDTTATAIANAVNETKKMESNKSEYKVGQRVFGCHEVDGEWYEAYVIKVKIGKGKEVEECYDIKYDGYEEGDEDAFEYDKPLDAIAHPRDFEGEDEDAQDEVYGVVVAIFVCYFVPVSIFISLLCDHIQSSSSSSHPYIMNQSKSNPIRLYLMQLEDSQPLPEGNLLC
jgi:hypothetical protein